MWSRQVCAGDVVASCIWAVPVLLLLQSLLCSCVLRIYLISFVLFIILSFIKYSFPFTNMTSCLGTIRSKTKTLIFFEGQEPVRSQTRGESEYLTDNDVRI